MTSATTAVALPDARHPDFWVEAFNRIDPAEAKPLLSLDMLFEVWNEKWREGMTINQRQRVIVAKNKRKSELGG